MRELTKVVLENEMDLILAHKQSMKLAELAGVTISGQTSFATAVSEICRTFLHSKHHAALRLFVSTPKSKMKSIFAQLETDRLPETDRFEEGLRHARKLVPNTVLQTTPDGAKVFLEAALSPSLIITERILENWSILLNNDPVVSPYEEIKRKNRQLLELSEKLQHSEQQYKLLADSLPIMIYTFSTEGILTYANKWLLDYAGLSIDQLNQHKFQQIYHPEDFDKIWANWSSDHDDELIVKERRLRGRDGQFRWHTGISIPIKDEAGKVLYWNAFMVDIHAQKIIEETLKDNIELKEIKMQLEQKVEELNLSNRLLEQFAFATSHDMQEPLRKIAFFSNYLTANYADSLGEGGLRYLEKLIGESDRIRVLIDGILNYSTISADEQLPELVDLNEVIEEIISDMDFMLQEKEASISYKALPDVMGSRTQMKQLFTNLISNSLKFSAEDRAPRIEIYAERNADGTTLFFKDNGIGFDNRYASKIFELFKRLHPKDEFVGTGIGLAVCKRIVELHNGSITADGALGQGAVFCIRF